MLRRTASCRSGSEPSRPPRSRSRSRGYNPSGHSRVDIVDLRDGIFFAELVFDNGVTVSARPSDAIALALRTGSPLFAADHVLDEAAIEMPAEDEDEVEGDEEGAEAEVEAFREFLDHVTPEDFEGGSPQ